MINLPNENLFDLLETYQTVRNRLQTLNIDQKYLSKIFRIKVSQIDFFKQCSENYYSSPQIFYLTKVERFMAQVLLLRSNWSRKI